MAAKKNSWGLAERLGLAIAQSLEHLLGGARWDRTCCITRCAATCCRVWRVPLVRSAAATPTAGTPHPGRGRGRMPGCARPTTGDTVDVALLGGGGGPFEHDLDELAVAPGSRDVESHTRGVRFVGDEAVPLRHVSYASPSEKTALLLGPWVY